MESIARSIGVGPSTAPRHLVESTPLDHVQGMDGGKLHGEFEWIRLPIWALSRAEQIALYGKPASNLTEAVENKNYSYGDEQERLWTFGSNAIPRGYEYTEAFSVNTVLQMLLSVVSILLNSLVVIISLKTSRKRSAVALSLYTRVSLSFADIAGAMCTLVSVLILRFYDERRLPRETWNFVVVLTLLQMFFTTTSFCHLILMSIRR